MKEIITDQVITAAAIALALPTGGGSITADVVMSTAIRVVIADMAGNVAEYTSGKLGAPPWLQTAISMGIGIAVYSISGKFFANVGATETVEVDAAMAKTIANGTGGRISMNPDLPVVNGKIGGKVSIDDYLNIRTESGHNMNSAIATFGKYEPKTVNGVPDWSTPSPKSYTVKAGDTAYFDLGSKWGDVMSKYELTPDEMFDYFNKPAIDDMIVSGKQIRFSHDPTLDIYKSSALRQEWDYLKSKYKFESLKKRGDFYYAK